MAPIRGNSSCILKVNVSEWIIFFWDNQNSDNNCLMPSFALFFAESERSSLVPARRDSVETDVENSRCYQPSVDSSEVRWGWVLVRLITICTGLHNLIRCIVYISLNNQRAAEGAMVSNNNKLPYAFCRLLFLCFNRRKMSHWWKYQETLAWQRQA